MPSPQSLQALTLWPEWAWAIVHLGKRVENRSWSIPRGKWFALHAGKHIGGKSGAAASIEGIESLCTMARRAEWFPHGTALTAEFVRVTDAITVVWEHSAVQTSSILGVFRVTANDPPGRGDLGGALFRGLREVIPGQAARRFSRARRRIRDQGGLRQQIHRTAWRPARNLRTALRPGRNQ